MKVYPVMKCIHYEDSVLLDVYADPDDAKDRARKEANETWRGDDTDEWENASENHILSVATSSNTFVVTQREVL